MRVTYRHRRIPEYVVRVFHMVMSERDLKRVDVNAVALPYSKRDKGFIPNTTGGVTICTIEENGKTFTGSAVCSLADGFCYATGRHIAYDRALAKLNAEQVK